MTSLAYKPGLESSVILFIAYDFVLCVERILSKVYCARCPHIETACKGQLLDDDELQARDTAPTNKVQQVILNLQFGKKYY